jgi:DNA-binding IclR family transcriptional regulator
VSNSSSHHIFEILRLVAAADEPLGVTDIGRRLALPTTTAHRGLATLEETGYVARWQSSSRYVLGDMAARLSQAFFARFRVRELATPFLRQFAIATGETASLSVPVGWYAVRIASVEGLNEVIHTAPLGEIRSLGDGIGARAILAFLPEGEIERYLRRPETERHRDELPGALAEIRRRGFAAAATELKPGSAMIALPIRGPGDEAVASITLEGPVVETARLDDDPRLRAWTEIAGQLEAALRAHPEGFANPYAHLDRDGIQLPLAAL